MQFTYESYAAMLQTLSNNGYQFKDYTNWQETEKTVIMRHDVDNSLQKAAALSAVEKECCPNGIHATYFVLVSTDFYNIHSSSSREYIQRIIENGGRIGLHFDETQYAISEKSELTADIQKEADILSELAGQKIRVVSMHRPSQTFLSSNITFPDIINSYNNIYFKEMKYVSDSRRHWRENIDEIIAQAQYLRLHILTHALWYRKQEEYTLQQTLREAVLNASLDYYDNLCENFQNLEQELSRSEIEKKLF